MAEDFQAGICGENWWNINPSRSVFPLGSSPCSMAANDSGSYNSSWQNGMVSDSSLGFLDSQKTQQMDCTLQMMGFGLSSSSTNSANWNQSPLRCSGRPEGSNFHSVIQEEARPDSNSSQIQVSTIDAFKPMNQEFSYTDQQSLSSSTSTGNSTVTNCQGLSGNFPVGSASYGFPSSTLMIQSLYDSEPQLQPLFTNPSVDYNSSTENYGSSSNEISPTWSKVATFFKPSLAKQQASGLHFSNNTPFWNASAEALNDIRAGVFASSQPQYQPSPNFDEKPNFQSLVTKPKVEEVQDSSLAKKNACEPVFKRPRTETPSPLPTFKVRKEKLGDRITALQQLVSPFGKTDTASVLHEAIEYIKFLHDQVNVLSGPYMKTGAPVQHRQGSDMKDLEGPKQDLRSRGLCLVPISSTFPVANETTADFWTPTFGGAFMR